MENLDRGVEERADFVLVGAFERLDVVDVSSQLDDVFLVRF